MASNINHVGLGRNLLTWVIDDSFLNSALIQLDNADVLSLDIFDTAVTRVVTSPVDVFAEVERRLTSRFGQNAAGFGAARIRAERRARRKKHLATGQEDLRLADIYKELGFFLPDFSDPELAAEIELAVERDYLQACPDIKSLAQQATKRGKRLIFVSDMYLPSEFLADVLADFPPWEHLYVSGEIGLTKSSGNIWHHIRQQIEGRILHIGDNKHSDVTLPAKHGVVTLQYTRAVSFERTHQLPNVHTLPFSLIQRHLVLKSKELTAAPSRRQEWFDFGQSFGAIVVGTFLQWLEQRIRVHKIDRIYLCARDGWLIKRAWDAAGLSAKLGVEARYLAISRRVLNLGAVALTSTPTRLDVATLSFLSSSLDNVSVGLALSRAGLQDCQEVVSDAVKTFGSLDAVPQWPEGTRRLEDLFQRHASTVYKTLANQYLLVKEYLHQENLTAPGRAALVDLGWHGTMQRSVQAIVRNAGSSTLVGFYYGLWPQASSNRFLAGPMESCFANEFLRVEDQAGVHYSVAFLEELHTAPHGTVIGYTTRAGAIEPLFAEHPLESEQHAKIGEPFQDGVVETIRQLFEKGRSGPLMLTDLKQPAALSAIDSVFLAPTNAELNLLAEVRHCGTFDHASFDHVLSAEMPKNQRTAYQDFLKSPWPLGQLRLWTTTATREQKSLISKIVQRHLSHLDDSITKQFI